VRPERVRGLLIQAKIKLGEGIMSTLFSYCIPYDDGAAPNPFWGLCTLAICKPRIRQSANVVDWVVSTGSAVSPVGNVSDVVVYAMLVTQKMTMEDYDRFTQSELPSKIPVMDSADLHRRFGDSIYDFATRTPSLRPSVHGEENRSTDLSGGWVLLSDHFFYFGDGPIALPEALLGIVKKGQCHKSSSNTPYFDCFVRWILVLTRESGEGKLEEVDILHEGNRPCKRHNERLRKSSNWKQFS